MRILVSNDDGILARGVRVLAEALRPLGEVLVVAPEREQSGCSRAITLERPLRVRQVDTGFYAVDGTPTDCIVMAARGVPGVLRFSPDLVVSGINHGANLGDDVTYSGTVAAAMEGCLLGVPSMAISLAGRPGSEFDAAGRVARALCAQVAEKGLPRGILLNVNVPDRPFDELKGVRATRLGRLSYPDTLDERRDPWGRPYFWIGGESPIWEPDDESDHHAVKEGFVSVSPIHLELTEPSVVEAIRGWNLSLDDGSGA